MNREYGSSPRSLRGCAPRPAQDGLLPVHPLVLDEVPATLRASTLILKSPRRRCPPAANPRSCTGGWSGRGGSAPSGELPLPSPSPRIQRPSHPRHASRRVSMGISLDACGVKPPRRHEALGAHWSRRTTLRRSPLRAPEGQLLRVGNLGIDCPSFPTKVGSNQNAPKGQDTLAQDTLAHHKGEGHAAQRPSTHKTRGCHTPGLDATKLAVSVVSRAPSGRLHDRGLHTPGLGVPTPIRGRTPSGWLHDWGADHCKPSQLTTETQSYARPSAHKKGPEMTAAAELHIGCADIPANTKG